MFGIGLGEIFLIILVTFLISPKEIPKVLRKTGEIVAGIKRMRQDIVDLGKDVRAVVEDELPEDEDIVSGRRQKNRDSKAPDSGE